MSDFQAKVYRIRFPLGLHEGKERERGESGRGGEGEREVEGGTVATGNARGKSRLILSSEEGVR